MRTQRPSQLCRKARMISSGRAAAMAEAWTSFSTAWVRTRWMPGSGWSQKVARSTSCLVSSSMTVATWRLTTATARSSGAAVASCSVAGDRLASAALAAGEEATEIAGATARSEAKYAARLMVTMERSPTPAREVGRRTRAAASLCSAVAEVPKIE